MFSRLFYKIQSFFKNLLNFFENIWLFRKALWNYWWFSGITSFSFLKIGLEITERRIRARGIEMLEPRLLKCDSMRRAVEIIDNIEKDNYLEMAEKLLGYEYEYLFLFDDFMEVIEDYDGDKGKYVFEVPKETNKRNKKIILESIRLEDEEWDELFKLLKGQDYSKFKKEIDFYDQFDGTGIKNWWD